MFQQNGDSSQDKSNSHYEHGDKGSFANKRAFFMINYTFSQKAAMSDILGRSRTGAIRVTNTVKPFSFYCQCGVCFSAFYTIPTKFSMHVGKNY